MRVALTAGKAYKGEKEGVMVFTFPLPRPINARKVSEANVSCRFVSFPTSFSHDQESAVQLWSSLAKDGKTLEVKIAAPGMKIAEILRFKPPSVVEATISMPE